MPKELTNSNVTSQPKCVSTKQKIAGVHGRGPSNINLVIFDCLFAGFHNHFLILTMVILKQNVLSENLLTSTKNSFSLHNSYRYTRYASCLPAVWPYQLTVRTLLS